MTAAWAVRPAREDEVGELRRVRLEALQDTPLAFSELYAEAVTLTDEDWAARARRNLSADHTMVVAVDEGDRWVGLSGSFVEDGEPVVFSVYVTPSYRGTGVTDALFDALEDWARGQGHRTIRLQVHEDNPVARRFYARRGYVETGERSPYEHPPYGDELTMRKKLTD